jgi:hypothetical protein
MDSRSKVFSIFKIAFWITLNLRCVDRYFGQLLKMAAASQEARDRLQVHLQDIVSFFEEGGCESKSVAKLRRCVEAHSHFDFLELSEGYSKCMAFIDHDTLSLKIQTGWNGIEQYLLLDKKVINRKLRVLEEDKKSDPEVIAKLHAKKDVIDQELARVKIQIIKYTLINSVPTQRFYDKNFNALAEYDRQRERKETLLGHK